MQIIVHIGQPKTASTLIQTYLAHNREQLATQGVLYPMLYGKKAGWIAHKRSQEIMPEMCAALSKPWEKVILSEESFYNYTTSERDTVKRNKILNNEVLSEGIPAYIRRKFAEYATSWRILCYVRRPDEHIVSQYQQRLKVDNYVLTLDEFYNERMRDDYYRYAHQMGKWAEVFGADAVEVRVFHRRTLEGAPHEDFAHWIGLDTKSLRFHRGTINESFDRLNTEIMHILNRCRFERPDLLRKHDVQDRQAMLRRLDTGDRLRLDPEQARRLHEQFREDHELLAQRHLSAEHAAVLLAPPSDTALPPLDRQALHGRMTALFNDPELAGFAVDRAGQPADRLLRRKFKKTDQTRDAVMTDDNKPRLSPEKKQARLAAREKRQAMLAAREKRRAAMTPEQRAKAEARDAARRSKLAAMTPEERAAFKAKRAAARAAKKSSGH